MLKSLAVVVAATLTIPIAAQSAGAIEPLPENDNFADATQIALLPFSATADTTFATPELFEPESRCGRNSRTVWYWFTPPQDVEVYVDTVGTSISTSVAVYTGNRFRDLAAVACSYGEGGRYYPAFLRFQAGAGITYYLQVANLYDCCESVVSRITLNVTSPGGITGKVTDTAGNPLKEICVTAVDPDARYARSWARMATDTLGRYSLTGLRPGRYIVSFDNCSWGGDYFPEYYDDKPGQDLADRVEVPSGTTVSGIDASMVRGGAISGRVTNESGDPIPAVCVGAYDASGALSRSGYTDPTGAYRINRLGGGDYRLRLTHCDSLRRYASEWYRDKPDLETANPVSVPLETEVGGIDAALARLQPPTNDRLPNAKEVSAIPFHDTLDISLATAEAGEPKCSGNVLHTVWYRFTPVEDTELAVRMIAEGQWGNSVGVWVASGLDTESGDLNYLRVTCRSATQRSGTAATFHASAGTTYYIQIASQSPGQVEVHVEGPPLNDAFTQAVEIVSLQFSHTVITHAAGLELGEPQLCHSVDHGHSVWYKYTPSSDATISADTFGSDFNTVLAVYTATGLGTGLGIVDLEQVACVDNSEGTSQSKVAFTAAAGKTYYFQVAGWIGDSGELRFNVQTPS